MSMVKRRLIDNILISINTCVFVGYVPFAPGTFASLFAVALIYLFPAVFTSILFAIPFVLFAVLCVNTHRYEGEDPGYIVIDEFAGMCIAMAGHRATLVNCAIGFVLFRVFDILKPYPIKRVERLKKGYGVVGDDVLAGIFANAILFLLGRFI